MSSTRERLVHCATQLFQQRGYHAIGLNEILSLAVCPKGSLYHHFPKGKSELATSCLQQISNHVTDYLRYLFTQKNVAKSCKACCANIAKWGEAQDWEQGSLMLAFTQEIGPGEAALEAELCQTYQTICSVISQQLIEDGVTSKKSTELAWLIVSSIEGALSLCRATKSKQSLLVVGANLEQQLSQYYSE